MPVKSDPAKGSVPPPPCPVDGPGSAAFSNAGLAAAILVAPALVLLLTNAALVYYPLLLAVLALPTCTSLHSLVNPFTAATAIYPFTYSLTRCPSEFSLIQTII